MNKFLPIFLIVTIFIVGCKKEEVTEKTDEVIVSKYAKYRVGVRKEKELKNWLATLEKAEKVDLLEETSGKNKKGKIVPIGRIRLAGDEVGYVELRHLADEVIVFTEDTKAYIRPTKGTKVVETIPKGKIGFVIREKGHWVQVWIGEINGKNITKEWVNGGYSSDKDLVLKATEYERAVVDLESKEQSVVENAKKLLEKVANGSSIFAMLAKEKLGVSEEPQEEEMQEKTEETSEEGQVEENM